MEHNEPELLDSENVMMVSTITAAKNRFRNNDVFDNMVLVTRWLPLLDEEIGLVFQFKKKRAKSIFTINVAPQLRPIIKEVDVKWSYSQDKIQTALKICSLMGWNNPEIYCPKVAYPLMIRTGKRHTHDTEAVILIAPRIQEE